MALVAPGQRGRRGTAIPQAARLANNYHLQGGAQSKHLGAKFAPNGLVERFHEAGAVPVFYLNLVFWSCLLVHLLGLPVGVLAGYRRR